jgi:hypothetical protein
MDLRSGQCVLLEADGPSGFVGGGRDDGPAMAQPVDDGGQAPTAGVERGQ